MPGSAHAECAGLAVVGQLLGVHRDDALPHVQHRTAGDPVAIRIPVESFGDHLVVVEATAISELGEYRRCEFVAQMRDQHLCQRGQRALLKHQHAPVTKQQLALVGSESQERREVNVFDPHGALHLSLARRPVRVAAAAAVLRCAAGGCVSVVLLVAIVCQSRLGAWVSVSDHDVGVGRGGTGAIIWTAH